VQAVVGLGGSAGSIRALQTFFSRMPGDSGLAFVVVLHLSPQYESSLAALLQKSTPMLVTQVSEAVKIEANCVYVIPPGKHLLMASRYAWVLLDRYSSFRFRWRRIIGIKRIKENGGLTVAQDPGEAEHKGMPRSAIEAGLGIGCCR
jgi:two-component system CheB/CheR fusion protein